MKEMNKVPYILTVTAEDAQSVEEAIMQLVGVEENIDSFFDLLQIPLVKGFLTLAICLVLAKVLLTVLRRMLARTHMEETMCKFVRSILTVLVYAVALLIAADSFGINVSSLVAVLSIFGAAMALAAQNSLANFFGGVLIMMTKPFLVGDYISCSLGEGTVQEVGLINTKLRMGDNRIVTIPNDTLSTATVINYSKGGTRRIELDFSVSYDAPIDRVEQIMLDVIEAQPTILHEPEEPFARITAFAESSVTYSLRVWCSGDDYWSLRFDLLEQIKKAFDREGISMPYNQMDIHVITDHTPDKG